MSRAPASLYSTLALFALAGCGQSGPPALLVPDDVRSGLSDGSPLATVPWLTGGLEHAVGRIEEENGQPRCTGVLVAERHVLTARHCFALLPDATAFEVAAELAGLGFRTPSERLPLVGLVRHAELDLALVTIGAAPAAGASLPFSLSDAFGAELVGSSVTALGAGRGTPTADVVASGTFTIAFVEPARLELGPTDAAQLCPGDSGAPVLLDDNGAVSLIGIHSTGHEDCSPAWYAVRVDVARTWVAEVVAASTTAPAASCASAADVARCDGEVAQNCVDGWWWSLDCALDRKECSVDDGRAACPPIPCGSVPPAGLCEDGVARVCLRGSLIEDDCAALGGGCALDPVTGRRACVPCPACDGRCTDVDTDPENCGECGNACVPDGRGSCVDGECVVGGADDSVTVQDAGSAARERETGCLGPAGLLAGVGLCPLLWLSRRRARRRAASFC